VRVAVLFNPNNASNRIFRDEIETATQDLGISLGARVEGSKAPRYQDHPRGATTARQRRGDVPTTPRHNH
jgi:hypothetical protein